VRLDDLLERVVLSEPGDWHVIAGDPSYRDKFDEVQAGEQRWIEIASHHTVAAFIPDASITMAWGLRVNEDFKEPWANGRGGAPEH
jgi:hypothetical protein